MTENVKIQQLTIRVDRNQSWWLEIVRRGEVSQVVMPEPLQVKKSHHCLHDQFLICSTVKGKQTFGGPDMQQLYLAVNNVLKVRSGK